MSPGAFFIPDGDRWVATENTRGPWSNDHQHAGPPAALLGRAIERAVPEGEAWQVARITYELLRPIPITRFTVRIDETRATRRTRLLQASLATDEHEVVRAAALLIRSGEVPIPPVPSDYVVPAHPDTLALATFPFFQHPVGYHTSMELRIASGGFGQARTHAWMRMLLPLVEGEQPSPLQRVLVAADSGNGITNVLDFKHFTFVNPDLTVTLHRLPDGEWVGLDAYMQPERTGIGLAHSRLHDTTGPLGHALQTLLLTAR